MSWTSPLTVASTIVPLLAPSTFSMKRLEVGDRRLHGLGATAARRAAASCREPKSSPTTFMPSSRMLVDDRRAAGTGSAPRRGSASRPCFLPSMMRRFSRSSTWRARLLRRRRRAALRLGEARHEGDAAGRSPPAGGRRSGRARPRASSGGILCSGHDLGGVDDGAVEAALACASSRIHRVQHLARGGLEAEGDVREAEETCARRGAPRLIAGDAPRGSRRRGRGRPRCPVQIVKVSGSKSSATGAGRGGRQAMS